jgi:hypothetical protein
MTRGALLPTRHAIPVDGLRLFFLGLQRGTVTLVRGARFNTLDRPMAGGRWGLLSRPVVPGGVAKADGARPSPVLGRDLYRSSSRRVRMVFEDAEPSIPAPPEMSA